MLALSLMPPMTTPLRLLALVLALGLLACSKDGGLLSITRTFDGEPLVQTIPPIPAFFPFPVTFPLPEQTIETNTRERLKEYGMKEANLKSAKIKTITITLVDAGDDFTLADVSDVVVQVSTASQPAVTVATYAGATTRITTDQLEVVDVNLREYVLDEPLQLTGTLKLLRPNTEEVTARIDFEYEVTGGI